MVLFYTFDFGTIRLIFPIQKIKLKFCFETMYDTKVLKNYSQLFMKIYYPQITDKTCRIAEKNDKLLGITFVKYYDNFRT